MKKIILLLIIFCINGFAQKVLPPPSRIETPKTYTKSDSTAVEVKATGDDKSQLELPDVLILGKDKTIKKVTDKKSVQQEKPQVIQTDAENVQVSSSITKQMNKPSIQTESSRVPRLIWAGLDGGGYTTINADAGLWQKIDKGDYRVNGWFNTSAGQHTNSAYKKGGFDGRVQYEMAPNVTGSAFANFDMRDYGLFNTWERNDLTRNIFTSQFGGDLQYDLTNTSGTHLGFVVNSTNFSTNNNENDIETDELNYSLDFGYETELAGMTLAGLGNFINEKATTNSLDLKNTFGQIGLQAHKTLNSHLTATLGVYYQSLSLDFFEKDEIVSPHLKLNYTPTNKMGISLAATSGYNTTAPEELLKECPFASHSVFLSSNKTIFNSQLEIYYQTTSKLKINLAAGAQKNDLLRIWDSMTNTSMVDQRLLKGAKLYNLAFGIRFKPSSKTEYEISIRKTIATENNLKLTTTDQKFQLPDSFIVNQEIPKTIIPEHVPYIPSYQIPIRASIELLKGLTLEADLSLIGERYYSISSDEKLDPYTLLNIQLNKKFGESYTATLSANNLLDADYEVWAGFPERNVYILAGFLAKF